MSVGTDLLNAPFPLIIRNLGVGIAEAQLELDLVSVKIARLMAGYSYPDSDGEDSGFGAPSNGTPPERDFLVDIGGERPFSLLELGFTPTFYQFVDTVIELKLSVSMSSERSSTHKRTSVKATAKGVGLPFFGAASINVSTVSASYSSKYQYSAEGSSVVRTKLVPVPTPTVLEERIKALIPVTPPTGGN